MVEDRWVFLAACSLSAIVSLSLVAGGVAALF